MARTRKSENQTTQDDQRTDAAVMLLQSPVVEPEAIWIWELEE
jgi:hypothetical protein